jgi:hypothetical protein
MPGSIWDLTFRPTRSSISKNTARTHLKNVFWPPAFGGIGASLKILDIQQYASGFKLGPAAILSQNPIFEKGSNSTDAF